MALTEEEQKAADAKAAEDKAKADATPKFMTADDFNRASTAREERFLKKIQEMMAKAAPSPAPTVEEDEPADEELAALPAGVAPPVKAKPSQAEINANKALKTARALEAQAKKDKEEAAAREKTTLEKEERSMALSALTSASVSAVAAKSALDTLRASGRIARNAEGDVVFLMPRDIAGEKVTDEMELSAGVAEWLETEEGKIFAPPRNVDGSGAKPALGGGSGRPLSKDEKKAVAGRTLMQYFTGQGT